MVAVGVVLRVTVEASRLVTCEPLALRVVIVEPVLPLLSLPLLTVVLPGRLVAILPVLELLLRVTVPLGRVLVLPVRVPLLRVTVPLGRVAVLGLLRFT